MSTTAATTCRIGVTIHDHDNAHRTTNCVGGCITKLRAHIEEFIALELTHKLDVQLASLVHSSVLDLDDWDGANLVLPRTLTTALLATAAERVIGHSVVIN
ncbi:hypothetical protein D3C78_267570 [compost metagenome]